VGLALSDHAVHDGPRAISRMVAFLRDDLGYRSPGRVVSRWAGVHAGSHDPGCEAALLEILVAAP
jgi:hypothetical protein